MKFYKGVLKSDLKHHYIPGTVTTCFKTALNWKERIQSQKCKGAARHVRHGESVIIEMEYEGELKDHSEFQRTGVSEHTRDNCWVNIHRDKAQINTPVNYKILTDKEIDQLFTF